MKAYLNSIHGIDDAIIALHVSKRHMTREFEKEVRDLVNKLTDHNGFLLDSVINGETLNDEYEKFDKLLQKVCTFGCMHTTLLRFINLSFTVYGLHRAGQDDWDSHAKRFDNRIVRESTRLAEFKDEKSDYYKDKILSTDEALSILRIDTPDTILKDGVEYYKTTNGYIRYNCVDQNDVKRGLYMLSIPSNFIFQVNLCEFAHVYKERNASGTANPEVKELAEMIADALEKAYYKFDRRLLMQIQN